MKPERRAEIEAMIDALNPPDRDRFSPDYTQLEAREKAATWSVAVKGSPHTIFSDMGYGSGPFALLFAAAPDIIRELLDEIDRLSGLHVVSDEPGKLIFYSEDS